MKRLPSVACFVLALVLLFSVPASADSIGIVNGSFETGDFTGWTLEHTIVPANFGFSLVRTQAPVVSITLLTTKFLQPSQGNFLASMVTGGVGMFNPSGGAAFIDGVRQSIFLNKGDFISGDVAWWNHDIATQDVGWVKLFLDGGEIANPFYAVSGTGCYFPATTCFAGAGIVQLNGEITIIPEREVFGWYPGDPCRVTITCYPAFAASSPGWKTWSFIAPESGVYDLEMAVQTHGDGLESSIAYFDNVHIPESTSLVLLPLALTGLFVMKRRRVLSPATSESTSIKL